MSSHAPCCQSVRHVGRAVGLAGNVWLQFTASTNNTADSNWVHADPDKQQGYSVLRSLLHFYGYGAGPKRRKESTSRRPPILDVYLPARLGLANGNWNPKRRNNRTHDNTFFDRVPYHFPADAEAVINGAGVRA